MSMSPKQRNDLLTQTDPGTPAGRLLRCYWQPVALTEEIRSPGDVRALGILGEELVLFRDERGRPGLLGIHCAHRCADLSYGRVEDGGLRCLYHGWLFDVHGHCLEQPNMPAGATYKDEIRQLSYPCREIGGIVFAYMGAGSPPEFPAYEALLAPEPHLVAAKMYHECNYLQGNEGNIDPSHLSFLHRQLNKDEPVGAVTAPTIEVEETDFGLRISTRRDLAEGRQYLRVSNFVFPNLSAIPGETSPDGYTINWHVPIDDRSHWKYMIAFCRSGKWDRQDVIGKYRLEMNADYTSARNKSNRYLQDRASMNRSFSGLGGIFRNHDLWAWEGQGRIEDRTSEHLGYSDLAIVKMRRAMLEAIQDVLDGEEPPHVIRPGMRNDFQHLVVVNETIGGR